MTRSLRVLHCPGLVGGHPPSVAAHERALGLDSHCVAFRPSPFAYAADEILAPPGTSPLLFELRRWRLLARAAHSFDVVHFNFGRTIAPDTTSLETLAREGAPAPVRRAFGLYVRAFERRDLAWLRRLGKRIVVTFQGDDARRGDILARLGREDLLTELEADYYTAAGDAARARRVAGFDRYAHALFALNPDLLHGLPERARFLPYASVDLASWKPGRVAAGARPLVLHAPTHRAFKGTRFVLAAVERLHAQGIDFEFRTVEGTTRDEARRLYERADLFVDQLLVGWYGGVALELMALGKPVVCRLRDEDLARIPEAMAREMPLIRADPGSVESVLREWIEAPPERRLQRGLAARRWVERWHDPRRVAEVLRDTYESIPPRGSEEPVDRPDPDGAHR